MCERASAIILATACYFVQGSALADSELAAKALGTGLSMQSPPAVTAEPGAAQPIAAPLTLPAVAPAATLPAVAPVPAVVAPAPAAGREPADRRQRTRILSYILLHGLQGAGPFAGGR